MKAAVVTQDHQVNVTEKTLRPLQHGEALLKMDCCGVCHSISALAALAATLVGLVTRSLFATVIVGMVAFSSFSYFLL